MKMTTVFFCGLLFLPLLAQEMVLEHDFGGKEYVAGKDYVVFSKKVKCAAGRTVTVDAEAKSGGPAVSTLGAMMFLQENGRTLQRIYPNENWLTPVGKGDFWNIRFTFSGGVLKKNGEYILSLYRSNNQGMLHLRKVTVKQLPGGKNISFFYRNTPDIVSPLRPGPSGVNDYHIRISGANPGKKIREVEVTNDIGGRWVSGDDVKKNFWYVQYYDSADFPERKNPRNNFNGILQPGMSSMDLFFEGGGSEPLGIHFTCTVHYADGKKDVWKIMPGSPEKAPVPQSFSHTANRLVARTDCAFPENWPLPRIGTRSYWTTMDPPGACSEDMVSANAIQLRRLWSPAWFFPMTERRMNVSAARMKELGIPYVGQAALREFQVFDTAGKEISREAKVSGRCAEGVRPLAFVNDGDISLKNTCIALKPVLDGRQTASVTLDFGRNVDLGRAVLYHGTKNGPVPGWCARDFSLEYWKNGRWNSIPGGPIRGNRADVTVHPLAGLSASKLRLTIENENGLYDYGRFDFGLDNKLLDIRKADSIPPEIPFFFWYLGHDGYINHALPSHFQYDRAAYRKWREKHPLFLGFQIVEFDSDLCDFLGWREKRKFTAQKVYREAGRALVVNQELPPPPETREEAVNQIKQVFDRYKALLFDDVSHFTSATMWSHYGLEWGAVNNVTEKGNALSFAAARGACRQYGNKPWGVYFETFSGGGWTNYLQSGKDGSYRSGPDCGKSASLYRRRLFLAYLMGANFTDYEHSHLVLCAEKPVKGKPVKLSPHGKAAREVYEFDLKYPDRGIPYAPVALVLDWTHGWFEQEAGKIFQGHFAPTPADRHIDAWMNGLFRPQEVPLEGYGYYASQTGYSGIVDILVLNPPSGPAKTLNSYKAAILAGYLRLDSGTVGHLREYVRNGGTLLLSADQLKNHFGSDFTGFERKGKTGKGKRAFSMPEHTPLPGEERPYEFHEIVLKGARPLVVDPDGKPLVTVHPFGKGNVVVTLQKYLVEEPGSAAPKRGLSTVQYLLGLLRYETLPFMLNGNSPAEITVSRLKDGWRLGIINNQGVYKTGSAPARINPAETAEQTVVFKGRLRSAVERISGKPLVLTEKDGRSSFRLSIPPGELAIVDMTEK